MNKKLLLILVFFSSLINAEIFLKNSIRGNLFPNNYSISKDVKVFGNLTVNKGTTIKLNANTKLDIQHGDLVINGTIDEPVKIKTESDSFNIIIDSSITISKLVIQSDSKGKLLFNDKKVNKYDKHKSLNLSEINVNRKSKAHTPIMILSGATALCFGTLAIINGTKLDEGNTNSSKDVRDSMKKFEVFTYIASAGVLGFTIDLIIKKSTKD